MYKNNNNMEKKKVFLVGIKGVAMTAMAIYLKQEGYDVTGSDVSDIFPTDEILKSNNIRIKPGFKPSNINKNYNLVIATGAHGGMTNIEMITAKKLGIPVLMHGQMLGQLMSDKEGISVAGCHGKTTTSALVASILTHANYDPSYAIGSAMINDLGPAGHFGKGQFFIAEADEYMTCPQTCPTPRFLWQKPKILILTNIDYDHPDAYKNIDQIKMAYIKLIAQMPSDGIVIVNKDNRYISELLPIIDKKIITYGFSPKADYRIDDYYFGNGISIMKVCHENIMLGEYPIYIPGKHNLLNALAAGIAANIVGISWDKISKCYRFYKGTKRRFEYIYKKEGIMLYDDYAHHPEEINATLSSVKEWFPKKRIIVIFQPHTYSRTKALLSEFSRCFKNADMSLITDIYPSARERFDSSISSKILTIEINKYKNNSYYFGKKEHLIDFLKDEIRNNDFILTMGAGNIYLWHPEIVKIINDVSKRITIN
ncbi:UDP-N-acetylmuramate--L-alanine ligase [Candidatus Gottesmanbacteria bacterium CG_4_10_14_0_8_um_filter_37_24]|uniref:UDP-N-acetylmuramate--L-alanine ligase n=2 Tax=Candidatus Gottesmaniibacteriota TaxID=1752720 RepID=A0A2M7RRK8_9BACT|nr:MAG: UDP-N-acetylmuramate--L-alanine ligase [Candidatus Gottesmanbacteria bacterium CG_4_10_14_0_8_um_filter_37_24]